MDAAERAEFEANRQSGAALRLRRWDDAAKDPAATPPAFGYYKSLLRRLLRRPGPAPSRPSRAIR
jgi:gamma-butyrobetaine dioxygenase